jgi:hypothetical protein
VRHLFPQLVSNGYVPLPNRDKACLLPKWPVIEVTEAQAKLWARQLRWPAIGLRIEPPLLVIDADVPDPDIANAVRAVMPSVVLDRALERQGSPPKTAFFLRMSEEDELFREAHTRRYTFAGAPKPAFAVQAFAGGGGGAQFGAFGPHSHDEHGAVLKTYSWVGGRSPATVPIWDLPVLTRAEVFGLLDAADKVLAGWPGLVVDTTTKAGEHFYAQDYDLTDDMTFVDADGVEYTLEELEQAAKALKELKQPEMRVTGSFTGDLTSSGSARCKVHWNKRSGLSIVDFKTGDPVLHEFLGELFGRR